MSIPTVFSWYSGFLLMLRFFCPVTVLSFCEIQAPISRLSVGGLKIIYALIGNQKGSDAGVLIL